MKKFIILISLFLFIGVAKAEFCEVINGSGKAIGDEIKCGTEYFYVIKSGDNTTNLLTKYNLYVGDNISYIEADENAPIWEGDVWNNSVDYYCFDFARQHGYDPNEVYPMIDSENHVLLGCRIYELIDEDYVRQDEKAIGTFLENGKSKLPLYGITYMIEEPNYDDDGNMIVENTNYKYYFNDYKDELNNQGINVEKVSFITLDGFMELLKSISGKDIEINLKGYNSDEEMTEMNNPSTSKMDIKEYIPDKYKWIYDTTYWIGSGFVLDKPESGPPGSDHFFVGNDYYVSNEGILCALGRDICLYLPYKIGNGVRPVVTISNGIIKYRYKFIEGMGQDFNVVTNSNMRFRINMEYEEFVDTGKIFIDDEEVDCNCYVLSEGSTVVTFKDECSKKYSLGNHTIKATLNNGQYEAVTDFIISTENPIISKVKQMVENPNTSDKVALLIIIVFMCIIMGFVYFRKRLFSK